MIGNWETYRPSCLFHAWCSSIQAYSIGSSDFFEKWTACVFHLVYVIDNRVNCASLTIKAILLG